jgi:hypothetical protein
MHEKSGFRQLWVSGLADLAGSWSKLCFLEASRPKSHNPKTKVAADDQSRRVAALRGFAII